MFQKFNTKFNLKAFYTKHFLNILAITLFSSISMLAFCSNILLSKENKTNTQQEGKKASASTTAITTIKKPPTYGILVPLEHAALRDIVAGFQAEVRKQQPKAVFNIQNAQGDIKLQRSIIEQFVGQKVDIIVPIGTTATQMTLSYVKQTPIISLAAEYTEQERQKRSPRNITGVLDEIGGIKKIQFIKQIYPQLKKLTVIFHSGNEKNFKEVDDIVNEGKRHNIQVQKISINMLPELETAVKSVDKEAEAILILKDHLIASGIRLLIPTTEARHIPLISSDEGSVQEGASFALGMQERAIGEAGGQLANQVFEGESMEALPMQAVKDLAVFYNFHALERIQRIQDTEPLRAFAEKEGYQFISK